MQTVHASCLAADAGMKAGAVNDRHILWAQSFACVGYIFPFVEVLSGVDDICELQASYQLVFEPFVTPLPGREAHRTYYSELSVDGLVGESF